MIMSEYLIINSKKNNINFHVRMENGKIIKITKIKRTQLYGLEELSII